MARSVGDLGDWMQAARAGSQEALGSALETYRRYLLSVAENNLDPRLQAKGGASDLVQETFLEAQRDFEQFTGTTEAELLAWLRKLLLNNMGNFARKYRDTEKRAVGREVALPTEGSSASGAPTPVAVGKGPSPSGLAIANEQAQAIQLALDRLPEDYRRVIQLRYQEEKSFEEIGRLLNRSPDAARKLWSRAMQQLRQEWEASP